MLILTEDGMETLEQAVPAHVASVRCHFIDRLAPEDLPELERIAGAVRGPSPPDRGSRSG